MSGRRTTAAVAPADHSGFHLAEIDLDGPRAGEVLVELVATGMCHTDISAMTGVIPFPLPGVLGHEGAGRVIEVGAGVSGLGHGDPVLLSFTFCGACVMCRSGHPAYCDHHLNWNLLGGRRPDGSSPVRALDDGPLNGHFFGQSSFARHAIVDARCVVALQTDTSDEELTVYAPLGCGLQTGAGTVLNILRPRTSDVIAVSGAGAVGLAAVMAAAVLSVATVIVIDVIPARLALARELGASAVIDARTNDTRETLTALTAGRGVNAVIETTGNLTVLETMISALAVGGTCAVIGAPAGGSRASVDVNAHLPGRSIVGVTLGDSDPSRFIPELVALHRAGSFPIERLQRRYPFTDIARAAADSARGTTIKPVLEMRPR